MDTKVKNLNLFSSYYRLNRLSLGQISELLRLKKESYNISKLKCPDTGNILYISQKVLFQKSSPIRSVVFEGIGTKLLCISTQWLINRHWKSNDTWLRSDVSARVHMKNKKNNKYEIMTCTTKIHYFIFWWQVNYYF